MDDLIQGLPRSLKGASGGPVAAKLLARTTTRTFMPILIGLWLFFVLSGFGLSAKAENVGHDITAARVNDKGEYLNTAGELSKGGVGTRLPFMLRRFGTYFRDGSDAPPRVVNDGQWLRDNSSEASVTWVGHATFLVQMHGITFLTDPIWSDVPSPVSMVGPRRFVRPGILIEDLPRIDFVLISHNHYDHLDLPTLQTLAQRNAETLFIVPEGNGVTLFRAGVENLREFNWGDELEFGGLTIHCLPSQHWSKRSLTDTNKALWASWAVTGPNKRFYHAGDTGYFPGFKNIGAHLGTVDLAAMPIGAYAPRDMMQASHMNPEEAVQAAMDLGAKNMVGMHFGTFDLSDEPLDEPPQRFRRAAAQQGLNEESVWVMKVGETRLF
jgi:N-acyl-phosphatidylethanolamine-hydrolysing phospholipase D